VAAPGELVEVDEILAGALGPTPRSLVDLLREDAYGSRNRDVVVGEEGCRGGLLSTTKVLNRAPARYQVNYQNNRCYNQQEMYHPATNLTQESE
jgi:hypothetical protein